ncbi:hypothetical protein GCM10023145_31150 [Angustibacter luteus]
MTDKRTTTEKGRGRQWQLLCEQARRVYPPICWICHREIDLTLAATDRMSWTLDHLDPVATHGTQVPPIERTRPAHRAHNSSRKAGPPPQHRPSRLW